MHKEYIDTLIAEFQLNANPHIAEGQKAYMRHQFEFLGISSPKRKEIQKAFFAKSYMPDKEYMPLIAKELWKRQEREFQYFTQEFVFRYRKHFERKNIQLFEHLITHKSWWDTVDFMAQKLVGNYMLLFPEQRQKMSDKWIASGNMWLQRTAILFQLKYKQETDTALLASTIRQLCHTDEFFLNKAIGWALREYGKNHPDWVLDFAEKTVLHPLSRREGLRLIR